MDEDVPDQKGKQAVYREGVFHLHAPDVPSWPSEIKPSLRLLAEDDRASWNSLQGLFEESFLRLGRLRHPLGIWTEIVARKPGEDRFSLRGCRNRYQADHEIDLDDQGVVNEISVQWELESQHVISEKKSKLGAKTSVCLGRYV